MKHILIVDDDQIITIILAKMLSDEYSVTTKNSAISALEYLSNENYNEFDLILLDYLMPSMNGLEFLEKLKEKDIIIPSILLTSSKDQNVILNACKLGCFDFIDKTAELDNIKEIIKSTLELSKIADELKE
jgi:DNA-binding NtrC family response regulator